MENNGGTNKKTILIAVVLTVLIMMTIASVVALVVVPKAIDNKEETEHISQVKTETQEATQEETQEETEKQVETAGVPEVVGMRSSDAKDLLEYAGFKCKIIKADSQTVEYDYVISQSPISGSQAEKGSTINVYVSDTQQIDYDKVLYCCASEDVTLRTAPSRSASKICSIDSREAVEYISTSGEFIYVKYKDKKGYVLAEFFSTDPNAPLNYSSGNKKESDTHDDTTMYCCASDDVTLRTAPSRSASKICSIESREAVRYISSSGEFYYVEYNGKCGYALKKFFSHDPNAPLNYDES